jgi:hypothetical protein
VARQKVTATTSPKQHPLASISSFPTSLAKCLAPLYGTKSASAATASSTRPWVCSQTCPSPIFSSLFTAAANAVSNEPLSPDYQGILGLALPLNSIIAEQIRPQTGDAPDGAAWASNLFSITPVSDAPSSRFLSLTLQRPGSDRVPSLLGIGQHPPQIVKDPSDIQYSTVVSDPAGILFWKASVRGITVYVDSQPRIVDIGHSITGGVFPVAVIDSGVPFILTSSSVANGIYGAIDIHPAQDGKCKQHPDTYPFLLSCLSLS